MDFSNTLDGSPASHLTQDAAEMASQSRVPSAVLDTNVVLDWLVFANPRVSPIVDAIRHGALSWLSCPAMRAELARILSHRTLAAWSPRVDASLELHDRFATMIQDPAGGSVMSPRCSDVDDQVFVELALSTRATWLISHDRALLRMARRLRSLGVEVLTPDRWGLRAQV